MTQAEYVRGFEERAARTWPALESRYFDGWLIRFADGYTRRGNSVAPFFGSSLDVQDKIDYCEGIYTARAQPTRFKLTEVTDPPHLDALLDERGYKVEEENIFMAMDLSVGKFALDPAVHFEPGITSRWVQDYAALRHIDPRHIATQQAILEHMYPAPALASIREGDRVVAMGVASRDTDSVGIYNIVTHPEYRRQGYATRITTSLLHWARRRGAGLAFLQVAGSEPGGHAVYSKIGFGEVYRYWYRVMSV